MYRDEERDNVFGNFFNHIDNFPEATFLYVTSGGIEATKLKDEIDDSKGDQQGTVKADGAAESDDEAEVEDDKLGAEG